MFQRTWTIVRVLWVALCGGLIAYSIGRFITRPSVGVEWLTSGSIYWVSETTSLVSTADAVVSVDGVPVRQAGMFFSGKDVGQAIQVVVTGPAGERTLIFTLKPSTADNWLRSLGIVPVIVGFFLAGALLARRRSSVESERLKAAWISAWFLGVAVSLALGLQGTRGPLWTYQLYVVSTWWVGAVGLTAHLVFPRNVAPKRQVWIRAALLLVAGSGTALTLLLPHDYNGAVSWLGRELSQLWAVIAATLAVVLLTAGIWHRHSFAERRQTGIVAAGGLAGLIPFIVFALIPWLSGVPLSTYQFEVLPLLLIPCGYTYALLRFRHLARDRWVPRLVSWILSGALIIGAGLISIRVLSDMGLVGEVLAGSVAVLVAGTTILCASVISRGLDWLLYRRWYNPLDVTAQVVRRLDLRADEFDVPAQIEALIARELEMPSQVLVRQGTRLQGPLGRIDIDSAVVAALVRAERLLERDELLRIPGLSTAETQLIGTPWVQAAIALPSRAGVAGLLLLGHKTSAPFVDPADLTILQIVSLMAGQVLENAASFRKLQEAPRLIARARADERNYLARALHDDHLQPLNPFIWSLGALRGRVADEAEIEALREQISNHMTGLRQVCAHLRDNTLDSLGLEATVRLMTANATKGSGLATHCDFHNVDQVQVPVAVAESAVGVVREALANVVKHAGAKEATVTVHVQPGRVLVSVVDNGCGFDPEAAKSWAVANDHFGLVGLQEQALLVDGMLSIESDIGHGTRVIAHLPIVSLETNQPEQLRGPVRVE